MENAIEYWALPLGIGHLILCAFCQSRLGKVPNSLTLGAGVLVLCLSGLVSANVLPGQGGIVSSVVAGAIGFAMLIPFYAKGILGSACVKSNATFGIFLGCAFGINTAAVLVVASTIVSVITTCVAVFVWIRMKKLSRDQVWSFPAQVTLSIGSAVTILFSAFANY